jgi:hypothetical protein
VVVGHASAEAFDIIRRMGIVLSVIASLVAGGILATVAVLGGVSALEPSVNASTSQPLVNYDGQ